MAGTTAPEAVGLRASPISTLWTTAKPMAAALLKMKVMDSLHATIEKFAAEGYTHALAVADLAHIEGAVVRPPVFLRGRS